MKILVQGILIAIKLSSLENPYYSKYKDFLLEKDD